MDMTRPSPLAKSAGADVSAAQIAKAALRRLAVERLEPTPENYGRAYRHEAGGAGSAGLLPPRAQRIVEKLAARAFDGAGGNAAVELGEAVAAGRFDEAESVCDSAGTASSEAWATLIDRLVRGVERGSHNWTPARRKEAVARVVGANRSDSRRLQQRLTQLVNSWGSDGAGTDIAPAEVQIAAPTETGPLSAEYAAAPAAAAEPVHRRRQPDGGGARRPGTGSPRRSPARFRRACPSTTTPITSWRAS